MKLPAICLPLCLLSAPPAAPAGPYTDNVVILLDASGSMSEAWRCRENRGGKSAIAEVLKTVPASTHVGCWCSVETAGE